MNSPVSTSIDDLAARAVIETYGNISIITIPDAETLSESEHMAALKQAEALTPPLDQEEEDEESRQLDATARQDLESDGCPACYPPHLDVPVRNPPEEYRRIVEYWQSFSSTGDVVLCAQRSDWRNFRMWQQKCRDYYHNKSFSMFMDEIRERRRRHGLDDKVHLLLDLQQQSPRQNWVEFQDYHLKRHERQEKKRDGLRKDLDDVQKDATNTNTEDPERAAQHEVAIQRSLEYAERILRWHEVLLEWIEQRRFAMDAQPPTPVERDSGDQTSKPIRRASTRQRRSSRPDTSRVLGKARISKPTPKRPNRRTQTSEAATPETIAVDMDVTTSSSTQQIPKRRETKPQRAKEKPLGQLRPQGVAKTNRFADAATKSRSVSQRNGAKQTRDRAKPPRRSVPQRPLPAFGTVETRSGRILRPPVRWPAVD